MNWGVILNYFPPAALWGFVGTILGGSIAFLSAYMATSRTIKSQRALQRAEFEREDLATRAVATALLLDLYRFVNDAARNAVFEPEKWARPLHRLLDFGTDIRIGHALTSEQVQGFLSAGFEADLAFHRLSEEIRDLDIPFSEDFEERHPGADLDHAEWFYVTRIWILSLTAYQAINRALRAMSLAHHVDRNPSPSMVDVRDDYRIQIGRMAAESRDEGDTNERVWNDEELFG